MPHDTTGQLVYGEPRKQLLFALIPAEKAAAQALKAYLERQRFLVHAGKPEASIPVERQVRLKQVLDDFPAPQQQLEYPSASIVPAGDVDREGYFNPSIREDTYDPDRGTVVWQLGQATGLLQLDIWTDSTADMDAFYAHLPQLMSPRDDVTGLHLLASRNYLSTPIRFLLQSHTRRDQPDSAYAHERRMSASIRFDVADLAVRCAPAQMRPRLSADVR